MALKIRLKRLGKKKKPYYRVVVAENTWARDGKTVEDIGMYDPLQKPAKFEVKEDRVKHWLGVGAQPTETLTRLLGNEGLVPKVQGLHKKTKKSDKSES
ncbi:30S ribosomal protein S16 [bacterium]|jgi:small subunit ribosomal protein S16|nr:30S ribosomal protein S16 [bacterium]